MNKTQNVLHNRFSTLSIAQLAIGYHYTPLKCNVRVAHEGEELTLCVTELRASAQVIQEDDSDVRSATNRFLAISSIEDAKDFMEAHGPLIMPHPNHVWQLARKRGGVKVNWSIVRKLQRSFRAAWEGKWDSDVKNIVGNIDFGLNYFSGRPQLEAVLDGVAEALAFDLVMNSFREIKTAFCHRHDCRLLFERTTRHERIYCSPECAHLESVRKHRQRKAKQPKRGK